MNVETRKVTWVSKMGQKYLLVIFVGIVSLLFATRAFPSLYGDEYGSLAESKQILANLHAVGYFIQLNLWDHVSDQDWFLRVLSIIWLGLGIYWLNKWLNFEKLPGEVGQLVTLLMVLNPFLWLYGFQIRFYSYFFAASFFWIWRYRTWLAQKSRKNLILWLLSLVLLITAHLFGTLVVATTLLSYLWDQFGKKRWYLFGGLFFVLVVIVFSPVRQVLVDIVYRMTNNPPPPINVASRGISLAMLAKIPMTFYFFVMGERVYPLWWWITVPSLLIASVAFLLGLWNMRSIRGVFVLALFMLLNIPLLFLVLDPLAPLGLQGAAPRYVIYTLPYLMLVLAFGAQRWKFLPYALVVVSLVGLFCTAWPTWSYEQNGDRMDWKQALNTAIRDPQKSCLVVDGRSEDSVLRYMPVGTKMVRGDLNQCLGFSTIVLVSNDFRLPLIRDFDEMEAPLRDDYHLASNYTLFPTQITTFEKSSQGNRGQIFPSRLDLPEQDLRFPLSIPERKWMIDGFMRLDAERPFIEMSLAQVPVDATVWLLSDYRIDKSILNGTPVFSVYLIDVFGNRREIILKAGEETSNWDGSCNTCLPIFQWTKSVHLVGSYSYFDAYRQYDAKIWGTQLQIKNVDVSLKISFLLSSGTGYFWGIYPTKK